MSQKSKKYRFTYIIITCVIVLVFIGFYLFNQRDRSPATPLIGEEPVSEVVQDIRGTIAIIIDDFGYRNDEVSDGFLALDAPLTFAVIPGHEHSRSFSKKAGEAGFEIIVHMPMESHINSRGETEFRLNTDMISREIEERVEKAFFEIFDAVGLNNHQGSKATEDQRIMHIVADVLSKHQAYFVDSRTSAKTVAESTMKKAGVPYIERQVFLDNDFDPGLIYKQLNELVQLAESSEFVVGIGHVKRETLQVLREEIPKLKAKGFRFAFISEIL